MKSVKTEKSIQDYENLTDREHALKRAGMYMGQLSKQELVRSIYNPELKLYEQKTLEISEGFETLFDEILINAVDQQNKDPKMNEIRVTITDKSITVYNNGQGLPLDEKVEVRSTNETVWLPTMLFARFRSSENFNNERQGAGLNGIGAKIANCYCLEFNVETQHVKSKKHFTQTWLDNMGVESEPKYRSINAKDVKGGFVKITMYPDFDKFEMKNIDPETMMLLRSRVYDIAGFLKPGIAVYLNDELIPVRSFAEYADLIFGPDVPRETFVIKDENNKSMTRLEMAIAHSQEGFKCHGLINGLRTPDGSHVKAIVNDHLGKAIIENLSKRRECKDIKFQPAQFKDQVFLLVKMTVDNPEFNSQRKTEFVSKPSSWGFTLKFTQAFISRIESQLGIVEAMIALKTFKDNRALSQLVQTKKKGRIYDIPNLHDAENIGKPNRTKVIILTEGNSAVELAKAGIVVLGDDAADYGMYPLRGKTLNIREMKREDIMKSEIIKNMMRIIGLELGKKYESTSQLRYQKISVWADADVDGAHIAGLILNFLHCGWPSIFQIDPDFFRIIISPVGKASLKKSNSSNDEQDVYLFTPSQVGTWIRQQIEKKTFGRYDFKFLKGLGSSLPKDARFYFRNLDKYCIPLRYTDENDDQLIDMIFNSKRADERKQWLNETYNPDSYLPFGEKIEFITWTQFFNLNFIHFSNDDNIRSIPNVMDGFKPSQRKILWTFLEQNVTHMQRVQALMGTVMERAAYHHGDNSMAEAIISLAQNYVGTNNINLLQPEGLFGTRFNSRTGNQSNHSAPRYLFSCLEPIAREIFMEEDTHLLDYLEDDGKRIEPKFYVPVIPMILVNGTSGIGTGWSTNVPKYHPLDIVDVVENFINDWERFSDEFEINELLEKNAENTDNGDELSPELLPTLIPYYDLFQGNVERIGQEQFKLTGIMKREGSTIHVSELPPEIYTENWLKSITSRYLIGSVSNQEKKEKLEKKLGNAAGKPKAGKAKAAGKSKKITNAKEFIREYNNKIGPNVSVYFECDPDKLKEMSDEDIYATLGLSDKVNFNNVWAFDVDCKLRKFPNPMSIIKYFCYHRMPYYVKRRARMIEVLAYDATELRNKRRYLKMVMGYKGTTRYDVFGKTIAQVHDELEAMGFDKLKLKSSFRNTGDSDIDSSEASYWYLGKLHQWATTEDKLSQLKRECDEAKRKLKYYEDSTPGDLWLTDLNNFRTAYSEFTERKSESLRFDDHRVETKKKTVVKKPKAQKKSTTKKDDPRPLSSSKRIKIEKD